MPDDMTTAPASAAGSRRAQLHAVLSAVEQAPGSAKPDPILVADDVQRRFGGLTAVDVRHLEVQRGAITALIGPNGAGKTTLFNLLTGFDKPDEGRWSFNGRALSGVSSYKVARRGMVRTFQLTKSLNRLTVIENMRLGATGQRGESLFAAMLKPLWRAQEMDVTARADELLARFKLDTKRDDLAGSLSGGQRKLLEMARALMVGPEMVMLDEPMAGVNPALTQSLLGHVKDLREQGIEIRHTMEFDNIETVKRAVEIENGISIVPRTSVADETRNGSLVAVEIESFEMWRPLGVVYRRHRAISPAQKQFVALLKEPRWVSEEGLLDQNADACL